MESVVIAAERVLFERYAVDSRLPIDRYDSVMGHPHAGSYQDTRTKHAWDAWLHRALRELRH